MIDRDDKRRLEAEERAMEQNPEAALRRRDFLRRTAYTAGVAGASVMLPADTLLKQAAIASAQTSGLPRPRNMPIDHFVILMMENRSFDHYFGWHPDADGTQTRSYPDPQNSGTLVDTRHASTLDAQWQGCGHPDPDHGWDTGRNQLGQSKTDPTLEPDGFLEGVNDEFALCYYNEDELGFIHPAGNEFTVFDRFHCSLMASTWPNRYYKWSAQSGGRKDNTPPVDTGGNQWETLFDRALKDNPANLPGLGVTARYYNSDLPFSAVWGPRAVPWTQPIANYYEACATGTLPNITIVDPPFRDGGGGDGLSADEHPLGDVRLGQAFMSDVVHAFIESPNWKNGALFIVYDEWGGFFDHVRPPSVADVRQDTTNIDEDFGLMGFRVPGVVVSPYAHRGAVSHLQCGFESIIKLITYRFKLGNLTTRDAQANNIGLAMNWNATRRERRRPNLPDPEHIVSRPCSLGGGDAIQDNQASHASDLAELEGLAHRHGFKTGTGKAHEIFRKPDSVKKAIRK